MQRVRQPNRTTTNADRAKALLEVVRRRIERGEASHPELKAAVFEAFHKYFTQLSEPSVTVKPLVGMGLRDPKAYSDMVDGFKADINAAAADAKNLSDSVVGSFNYSTILAKSLEARSQKVAAKVQDLQMLSETFAEDTIVAGDNFADESRLDKGATIEVPQITVQPTEHSVVLNRERGENMLSGQAVTIRVLSTFRIYEGFFYAPNGESRPEGGSFHFTGSDNSIQSDTTAPGVPSDLLRRYNNWRSDTSMPASVQTPDGALNRASITAKQASVWAQQTGGWGPFSNSEWDMLANNYHVDPAFSNEPGLLNPVSRVSATDKGAPLDERNSIRQRMLDDNPDTFWECEYVIDSSEALTAQPGASSVQSTGQNSQVPATVVADTASNVPGGSTGQGNDPPTEDGSGGGPRITLGDLIDRITGPAIDKIDLDCTIILEMPEPRVVNWINLLPHNFSDATWLEVLDVSTSVDGAAWEEIDGLRNQQHENVLTQEANSELTPNEVAATMAPSKFSYAGQGVWTFPAREVKFVRIKLLQKTPVPAPYDVLKVEMTRTLTATHTGHRGTETTTYEQNKVERVGYLDTLKISSGAQSTDGLETSGSTSTNVTRQPGSTTADVVRDILDPGRFLHTPSQGASTTHEYSGWKVKSKDYDTQWDKARYAIGIKEIGVWGYTYSVKSGFVSVPFKSPKPIKAISLHTDEMVPKAFTQGAMKPWIQYWISLNDGQNWQQIAPSNQGVLNMVDGVRLPQTIHVNSGIPAEERDARDGYADLGSAANSVRIKVIMERPSDMEDMTPILKAYRLRMTLRGGL